MAPYLMKKTKIIKNMILGKPRFFIFLFLFLFYSANVFSTDEIETVPLINLE